MGIHWQHDLERTLADASRGSRPILLDFSAAPM